MQYRLQCCAIYYYNSLSPARVATYSVKRTCVSGWFVLPVGLYKWRITTAHPILTIRRVATCKSGKPELTSFSETLALFHPMSFISRFSSTGQTKWSLEIIPLGLFSSCHVYSSAHTGAAERSKKWGGGGEAEAGGRDEWEGGRCV